MGQRCKQCLPEGVRILIILLAVILMIVACWKLTLIEDRIPPSVKVMFTWFQFLGLYDQLSSNWQALTVLFNINNIFNADIQYFGFSCGTSLKFWGIWVLKLFIPPTLFAALVLANFVRMKRQNPAAPISFYQDAVLSRLHTILFTIMTLLSTMIFGTLFQMFNCVVQVDGVAVLSSDPSILCYDKTWNGYVAVAVMFVIAYVLVLPGWGFHYIYKNRSNPDAAQRLQPFIKPYREGLEFWEFVRLAFRLLFVVFRDVAAIDQSNKVLVLIFLLMAQIMTEINFQPFKSKMISEISLCWGLLSLVILLSLSVLESNATSPESKRTFAALLVFFVVVLIFHTLQDLVRSRLLRVRNPKKQTNQPTLTLKQ
eukprot:TRINITY_DN20946_c0_g1_i2.p1 TRINITY_DN20946_c0_g1~~TRINITY_DN20946_c0_g1_i2.p1  ORF type:complete len:369 (-),score=69.87 TRINITY_DN20946_c0_g1_i2:154-1260(-)